MSAFRAGYEVFVHGLPWTVSRKELSHYCSQFGKVLSSSVPFNKETGMSKGFGFVTFMNKDAVVNLTNKNVHFLEGSFLHFDPRSRRERNLVNQERKEMSRKPIDDQE